MASHVASQLPPPGTPPLADAERIAPLASFTLEEFEGRLAKSGYAPSHAGPILRRFYEGRSITEGLRLPMGLADRLELTLPAATIAARSVADDGTVKLLLKLADGRCVESVLMPGFRQDRAAGCLSSQVGCAMGCDFCATGQGGFERNLTSAEIVEQFLALRREAASTGRRLQTIVFMGMGEPMLNLDEVLAAIGRITSNKLGGLGCRQVTVSTVGIVPGIDALTQRGPKVHLAISLHAPDDATRERLLPPGRRFRIAEILAAADRHQEATGRIVTVQYCLLKGVNDSREHADLLASLLGKRRMHVNLLWYNPTGKGLSGATYERASEAVASDFAGRLKLAGVVAHLRRPRGRDIDAACGQLRQRTAQSG